MPAAVSITEAQRKQVKQLASLGLSDKTIGVVVGIKEATLQRRCRQELTEGREMGNAQLAQSAMQMARSGKHPAMTIFMCKVRLRWKETEHIELTGKDGKPLAGCDRPRDDVTAWMARKLAKTVTVDE